MKRITKKKNLKFLILVIYMFYPYMYKNNFGATPKIKTLFTTFI